MPERLATDPTPAEHEGFVGSVLYCADCKAVHRVAPVESAIFFLSDGTPSTIEDYQVFLGAHFRHRLQWLRRGGDSRAPYRPTADVSDSYKEDA